MTAKSGPIDSAHRYAGGYYDPATTLYKFGARYYNPTDKRWTQLDPSGQSFAYLYAKSNPVNYTDPSGYGVKECLGAAVVGVGGGLFGAATSFVGLLGAGTGLGVGVAYVGGAFSAASVAYGVDAIQDGACN